MDSIIALKMRWYIPFSGCSPVLFATKNPLNPRDQPGIRISHSIYLTLLEFLPQRKGKKRIIKTLEVQITEKGKNNRNIIMRDRR